MLIFGKIAATNFGALSPSKRLWAHLGVFNNQVKQYSSAHHQHLFTHVKTERVGDKKNIGLLIMNKPKVNSLSEKMMIDINAALDEFESDKKVGVVVLTGGEKIFSGGADIKDMGNDTFQENLSQAHIKEAKWNTIFFRRIPIIAAVNGYCLGGGLELAMGCDIIYAGKSARFGQPEIRIGVIPGAGGTQRLVRQVGKSRAMQMILTGEHVGAEEMERAGLVSCICDDSRTIQEAILCGEKIATNSQLATSFAKQAINKAYELPLTEGIQYERGLFNILFGSHDKQEGMKAFLEKRAPQWKNC